MFTDWAWCGIMRRSGKHDGSSTTCKWLTEALTRMTKDSVQVYLNEIGRYPLLNKAQEVALGTQVQAWIAIRGQDRDTYTRAELQIERAGIRAREKFINCNLRLVVNIARRYITQAKTLEFMDLVQEGNIGLARAVEKFDPTRGYAMSTYAYWWIRQAIQRALQTSDSSIRLPTSVHESIFTIKKASERLSHQLGREPTIKEVATEIGLNEGQVCDLLNAPKATTSLDLKCGEDDSGFSIIETIVDYRSSNTVEDAEDKINNEILYSAIDEYLDKTTRLVIIERNKGLPTTWKDLSEMTGLSKSKLQAMEKSGMKRCALMIFMKKKLSF